LAYIGVKDKKPRRPINQASSELNLPDRQDRVNDDSMQPHPGQSTARNKPTSHPASSLYEEGQAYVEKDYLYEAFAKIRAAFERRPTETKYRKSLIVLQKLSNAEFALRRTKAKWESQVRVPPLENLLAEAQQINQRVNDIEIEDYSLPTTFSAARTRLLHRVSNLVDEMALELSERPMRRKLEERPGKNWTGVA